MLRSGELSWLGPLIIGASLDGCDSELLARCLALPVSAGLRTLELRGDSLKHPGLGGPFADASCERSLRVLSLDARQVWLSDCSFDRLEQLTINAGNLELRGVSAPALRSLAVEILYAPDDLAACFAGLEARAIERFEFATEIYDYWDQHQGPLQHHLAATLRLPAFTRLRSLTLRTLEGSLPVHLGLAATLEQLPAAATLERIDLSGIDMVPRLRAELEARRDHLPELILPA